jgi:hypothetical protein
VPVPIRVCCDGHVKAVTVDGHVKAVTVGQSQRFYSGVGILITGIISVPLPGSFVREGFTLN